MSIRMKLLLAALLASGLAACAALPIPPPPPNEGSTSYHLVNDTNVAHYQLTPDTVATGGKPFERVLPIYPPSQLATCLPVVDVQAQVIVDTSGKASEVRRYPAAGSTQATIPPVFFDAVRTAVMQWQFEPLLIGRRTNDASGGTHAIDSEAKPFSLLYAFRFECSSGKATVSSTPAKG